MSELPISSPYRSTPDAAVTEDERNRLSARLNAAFEAGSLDAEEYRRRLDQLFGAATLGQLVPVVTGLPALQTYAEPGMVAPGGGRPGELSPARSGNGLTLAVVAGVAGAVVLLALLLLLLL